MKDCERGPGNATWNLMKTGGKKEGKGWRGGEPSVINHLMEFFFLDKNLLEVSGDRANP